MPPDHAHEAWRARPGWKGESALTLDDLDGSTGGLIALIGRAALSGRHFGVGGLADRLVGVFGRDRVFVEVQRHFRRDEHADNQTLVDLADAFHVPVIATGGVRFAAPGIGRSLMSSPAFTITPTSSARAGGWRRTPSGI